MLFLMGKKFLYKPLKPSFGRKIAVALLFFCFSESYAQKLPLQLSTQRIVAISADTYNRIITADEKGTIAAYDTLGTQLNQYSPRVVSDVTSLEAWRSMQILVFYRDLQQYTILDRFLTPLAGYPYPARLPMSQIGFARLMAFSYDDQFWLFDDTDFSLKKYNARLQTISVTVPMSLILNQKDYQIICMREYQNQLFIGDRNSGILIFDNLGNYRKTLPFKNFTSLQFYKNELYVTEGKTIHFYNLYTQAERKIVLQTEVTLAVVVENSIFVGNQAGVFLYHIP